MNQQVSGSEVVRGAVGDEEYDGFLARINARFIANTNGGSEPLFTTNAEGLFSAYLDALPPEHKQHHRCHACRNFVERFGGLVTILERGLTCPAIWNADDAPGFYRPAIKAMERIVMRAKVTGVFLSSLSPWGQPETGVWHHLSVITPASLVFKSRTQTAGQTMAAIRENYLNLVRALEEFSEPVLSQALTLLRSESLYRSEHVIGPAEFLYQLQSDCSQVRGAARQNIIWKAVAKAPTGFCHPRSSMVGSLLEDIASGMEFGQVSRRFADKMHPLQYQRPQAAPKSGNIAQAEKIVSQLEAEGALQRRYAHLEDIQTLWTPLHRLEKPYDGKGVFANVKAKGHRDVDSMRVPPQTMTWRKFADKVLPTAESIKFYVAATRLNYCALVTAVNQGAPPILQWDREDHRNPVSWYVWHGGSRPQEWQLEEQRWHDVTAITLKPSQWNAESPCDHHGNGVIFIIKGARETRHDAGAAIFPEILRSEFHGIRATIEAYSRGSSLSGKDEATACGLLLNAGSQWDARFRVASGKQVTEYRLDRWD
jgi:hypothetical protein